MLAEFDSDLTRMRTREGMKVTKAKGRLRGKPPKLTPTQEAHLVQLWRAGTQPTPNWASRSPSPAPWFTAPYNGAGQPKAASAEP